MSYAVRRRNARRRRIIRHLTVGLRQTLEWRARFQECPKLVNESPGLLKLARTIYQAELTYTKQLKSLGIEVTVEF